MLYYDSTYIILIPAIIFTFIAQGMVSGSFNKYSKVRNRRNLTGAQAARMVLDANGLRDVQITSIGGNLTDHYDPRRKILALSETVYSVNSVSAVSVACHEAGHAIQHSRGYAPLAIRSAIVPVVNFASKLTWPMVIIGIILLSVSSGDFGAIGNILLDVGIIAFGAIVCFHLITLPVEFNASKRAINQMEELGLIYDDEIKGSKKVLRAAALTYVAALAVALANMLRIIAISGRGRD